MARPHQIAIGEWYHCYNRGVDKRKVFTSPKDYERFLTLVYMANNARSTLSDLRETTLQRVLSGKNIASRSPLVEIGAYALMPNHIHFVVKEIQEGGVAMLMQKIFTGYTMYFNKRNDRTGALFAGTYKSKHLSSDRYFKHAINYVHLNPAELYEPEWKSGSGNLGAIEEKLRDYRYSSLPEHTGSERPERKILGNEVFGLFDAPASLSTMLFDAQAYYREIAA